MSTIKVTNTDGRVTILTIDGEPVRDAVRLWLQVGAGEPPRITVEELMRNGERTTRYDIASFTIEAEQKS